MQESGAGRCRIAWGLLATLIAACAPDARPPNVVVLTVDTLRADRLGVYGHERNTSPHIDRLAADGVVFDNAVTPQTMTQPSLAAMWTSLYPHQTGVRDNLHPLADGYPTLAEELRGAGIHTAAFVSNYVLMRELSNLQQGFDLYDDRVGETNLAGAERRAKETVDRVIGWLADAPSEPYFLWVHLMDPHGPYDPPAPFDRQFARRGGRPILLERNQIPLYQFRDSLDWRFYVDNYDGEIAYTDAQLGRLLDALRDADAYDDALVLFHADHGEYLGEHGVLFHHAGWVYEGALRIPLLLKPPGTGRAALPGRSAALVSLLDLAPTVLDALDLPIPEHYRGRSLLQLLRDDPADLQDREVFVTGLERVRGLRTADRIVIHDVDPETRAVERTEFYAIDRDPHQKRNLPLDREGNALSRALTEWRRDEQEYAVPFPSERRSRAEAAALLAERSQRDTELEAERHRRALEALGYVE